MPGQETILTARESFVFEADGGVINVRRGATVRVGHPMLDGREDMFAPLAVDFDITPRRGRPPKGDS